MRAGIANAEDDELTEPEPAEPVGYVVAWTPVAGGRRRKQWYQGLKPAQSRARRLSEQGQGVNVRIYRAARLDDISHSAFEVHCDPTEAAARRNWATAGTRRALLEEFPGVANRIRRNPGRDRVFSRGGRFASRLRPGGRR